MNNEQVLLERYLVRAMSNLRHRNTGGSPKVLRCNICGDSKSQPGATSAAILLSDGRWVYKCQRTGCEFNNAKLAVRWLRKTSRHLYDQYNADCLKLGYGDDRSKRMMADIERQRVDAARQAEEKRAADEMMDIAEHEKFRDIEPKDAEIHGYLRKRHIEPDSYPFLTADEGRFKDCIIFPVKENGKDVFWQGRKIFEDDGPKYLNKRGGKQGFLLKSKPFDPSRPVMVCEGPFSALSIENSVCTFGVQCTSEQMDRIKEYGKAVFCYDNDSGSEAGLAKMNELLKKGRWVMIWRDFLKKLRLPPGTNDMNDVAILIKRKVTWDDIKDCVSNDYYDAQMSMFM